MKEIEKLNESIESSLENVEALIEELEEREEFLCTGEVCGAHANLI